MRSRSLSYAVGVLLAGCTTVGTSLPPTPTATFEPGPLPVSRSPVAEPSWRPVRTFDEVRGLWVVRSTMTSAEEVRTMVADAAAAGFNTILVQVRGRGDAFYSSSLEPRAETVEGPPGFDPLALAVEEAHRRGLAVHAWVNTHLVWGPAAPPRSRAHIVHAHPDWLAVPKPLARSLHDTDPFDPAFAEALRRYAADRPQTVEGMYTSPSHPEVRARVAAVWIDLANRYDLDGIHFDYIRFPSADFDYSRGALDRFRVWVSARVPVARQVELDRAALDDPLAYTTSLPDDWDEFRRLQITSLVREIHDAVKARRPRLTISAAVVADQATAYGDRFQDWRGWLREGIIDVAVPMAYTPDPVRFQALVREARTAAGSPNRVWAGIGAYMNGEPGTLQAIDLSRLEGTGGVILFSYDWAAGEGRGDPADPFLDRVGRARFEVD